MKRVALAGVLSACLTLAASSRAQQATPEPAPVTAPVPPAPATPPPAPADAPPAKIVIPPDPNAQLAAVRIPRLRYANTWDLNLEAGVGSVFRDHDRLAVLGRGRAGMLFVRDNHFWQLGVTAEYLNLENGLWAQLGVNMDTKTRPGGMAALGFSIVGVEVQVREFEGDGSVHAALLGKIRIPIGIIAYAFGAGGGKL